MGSLIKNIRPSLKLTFSHLKMDGWKTSFLLGRPIFRGYVSFREGNAGGDWNAGWRLYPRYTGI